MGQQMWFSWRYKQKKKIKGGIDMKLENTLLKKIRECESEEIKLTVVGRPKRNI